MSGVEPRPEWEVARLAWPELEARAPATVGLLPVGAACKEHGRHLPLATDSIQVSWLCRELAGRLNVLVWPVVHYGYYPAFREFPGSPSLDRACFERTLAAVLDGMERSGHRRCVVVNGGISTIPGVDAVCSGRRRAWHVYSGSRYEAAVAEVREQRHGGHADELETSLMLHVAAGSVRLERDVENDVAFEPGALNRHDADRANYTPSGATGNPLLASREKGRRLAEAMLADGLDLIASLDDGSASAGVE